MQNNTTYTVAVFTLKAIKRSELIKEMTKNENETKIEKF